MLKPQDEVVVTIPQLHGNVSLVERGEIVSLGDRSAKVILANEDVPRDVPLDSIRQVSEVYGEETGRPNEMPVIDAIRY